MLTLRGLAMTPMTWSRSIISNLNPIKRIRRGNKKAPQPTTPVSTSAQGTEFSPKVLHIPSRAPQGQNARANYHRNSSTIQPTSIEDGHQLPSSTSSKRPNPTMVEGGAETISTLTLAGIGSSRVLLSPEISPDRDPLNESLPGNLLHPPPHTSVRRKRGTRQYPSPHSTVHQNASGSSPTQLGGRNEVLPLQPGLPTVLCINGGDCLVAIIKVLPDYRRDGAQPAEVAIVETSGPTNHRVVFLGENAFLVQILDWITAPRPPTSSNQGGTPAGYIPVSATRRMEAKPCDAGSRSGLLPGHPNNLYSGTVNNQSALAITRTKGKQATPRVRTTSLLGLQHTTEPSRPTRPLRGISQLDSGCISHDGWSTDSLPIFPSISGSWISTNRVLNRNPFQEPMSLGVSRSTFMDHRTHEEAIESIDSIHNPEFGQAPQPPIGTGRPSRFQDLILDHGYNAVSSKRQNR